MGPHRPPWGRGVEEAHLAPLLYMLLGVELSLLGISVALLVLSFREHRGRSELLEALFRATRALTRYEYFLAVIDSIRVARKSVAGVVTGRRPTTDLGRQAVRDILKALQEASRRGVRVRYVIYKSPDRLYMGYQYKRAGAEVRVSPAVALNDLRYMVVDEKINVLGLAGKEKGSPTRMGYVIGSRTLAGLLLRDFERLWSNSERLEDYAEELVREILGETPTATEDQIAEHLGIPREEAARLLAKARRAPD